MYYNTPILWYLCWCCDGNATLAFGIAADSTLSGAHILIFKTINDNKRNSNGGVLRNRVRARADYDCRVSYTHRKHQTMLIYCLSVDVGEHWRFRTRRKIIANVELQNIIMCIYYYNFYFPIPVVRKRVTHEWGGEKTDYYTFRFSHRSSIIYALLS